MIFSHSNKKGVTLMEVLISAIIFALVLIGMANLFIGGKRYIQHARARMTGGELGRYFLDPLQQQVRQDQWDSNCLGKGINCPTAANPLTTTINNINYKATYTTDSAANSDVRNVTAVIQWEEPAP